MTGSGAAKVANKSNQFGRRRKGFDPSCFIVVEEERVNPSNGYSRRSMPYYFILLQGLVSNPVRGRVVKFPHLGSGNLVLKRIIGLPTLTLSLKSSDDRRIDWSFGGSRGPTATNRDLRVSILHLHLSTDRPSGVLSASLPY